MDNQVSIAELKDLVRRFCEDRDWDQFHGPKDLAIGIVTEASELLEIFRFLSDSQCASTLAMGDKREGITNEIADVFFFILRFAQRFNIDLDESLSRKMKSNADKYPLEKARGKNLKYTDL
jgi:NTP pyrophosphatase (non-canonical NTP hydrolase)